MGDAHAFLGALVVVLGVAVVAVFVEWRAAAHTADGAGVFLAYAQAFLLLAVSFALAVAVAVRMRPQAERRSQPVS